MEFPEVYSHHDFLSGYFFAQVRSDASLFLTELIEEAVKLGVEWPAGQEHGSVEEPS